MPSAPCSRPPAHARCARSSDLAVPGMLLPPPPSPSPYTSPSRCPHVKETCRNTAAHPRHEVMYLKNAEGQSIIIPTVPLSAGSDPASTDSTDLQWVRILQGSRSLSYFCRSCRCSSTLLSGRAPIRHRVQRDITILDGRGAAARPTPMSTSSSALLTGLPSAWFTTSPYPRRSR